MNILLLNHWHHIYREGRHLTSYYSNKQSSLFAYLLWKKLIRKQSSACTRSAIIIIRVITEKDQGCLVYQNVVVQFRRCINLKMIYVIDVLFFMIPTKPNPRTIIRSSTSGSWFIKELNSSVAWLGEYRLTAVCVSEEVCFNAALNTICLSAWCGRTPAVLDVYLFNQTHQLQHGYGDDDPAT